MGTTLRATSDKLHLMAALGPGTRPRGLLSTADPALLIGIPGREMRGPPHVRGPRPFRVRIRLGRTSQIPESHFVSWVYFLKIQQRGVQWKQGVVN